VEVDRGDVMSGIDLPLNTAPSQRNDDIISGGAAAV